MEKIYIVDTTVLLDNPEYIRTLNNDEVVIPIEVMNEINSKNSHTDKIGHNARMASRLINYLLDHNEKPSIKLMSFKELKINSSFNYLLLSQEELILGLAKEIDLKEKIVGSGKKVIVLTKDSLLRVKGDAIGVICSDIH